MTDWGRFSNPMRAANPDGSLGRTWRSPSGLREVKQEGTRDGVLLYAVSTGGSRQMQLIRASELEAEIRRDERNYESRAAGAASAQVVATEAQQHKSWLGFTDDMKPTAAARADEVLSRQVYVQGLPAQRGDHIIRLVREHRIVKIHPRYGRILESPDGSFLTEKDLTKIGLDFAGYLAKGGQA